MAEVTELKQQLEKIQKELAKLSVGAAKAEQLEKELAETKGLVEKYKGSDKTVYINKDRKLEKFSGRPVKDTDPTAEEWIEDAIHHLKNIKGNDAQVEYLYDHLHGQAKDEIRIRPESDKNSAAKILDIVRTTFQDVESVGQLQQCFYQRNQKPKENLQEYSLVLLKLTDRIIKKDKNIVGDLDLMLKERFTDGVLDTQLRREMRRFMFEHKDLSFMDFRQMVLKWTENESSEKRVLSSKQDAFVSDEVKTASDKTVPHLQKDIASASGIQKDVLTLLHSQQEMLTKQQQQLDLLTQIVRSARPDRYEQRGFGERPRGRGKGRGRGPGSVVCYSCGGRGHMRRECPSSQTYKKNESKKNSSGTEDKENYQQNLNQ